MSMASYMSPRNTVVVKSSKSNNNKTNNLNNYVLTHTPIDPRQSHYLTRVGLLSAIRRTPAYAA